MEENTPKNNESSPSFAHAQEEERAVHTEPRIRTMKSDVNELFHDKKETVFSAIAKEPFIDPAERLQKKDDTNAKKMKLFAVGVFSALFLLAGTSGAYYYFFSIPPKKTTGPEKKPEIFTPRPFFSMEKSRNIIVRVPDIGDFTDNLTVIQNDLERGGTMKRIVLIMRDKQNNERIGSLKDFLSTAGITLPKNLENEMVNDINFFLYYQTDQAIRRGLIIPILSEIKTFRALVDHETAFFETWKNLYDASDTKPGQVLAFEDITYRNIDIRRMQFDQTEDIGFYYAIFKLKKYLIITTSFEEMKVVLDRVLDTL